MKQVRCAIISVGNKIKSDDDIGNRIIKKIPDSEKILKINGGLNPENFIQKVKEFRPDRIFIMDAVDSGDRPGSVKLIPVDDVRTLLPSTHSIPAEVFKKIFPGTEILVIGIEPKSLDFGEGLSPELEKEFKKILEKVKAILLDH